ncbi:FecR family protein [Steroidobacter cummioxidans]|uniref:FecR family protein n=1 Tax=Steroidobacter cummioxidans TaxID=1803913 RepID=UPI000E32417C|nr:FecR domain-containing protein [Steroidobacter cummioxidans]
MAKSKHHSQHDRLVAAEAGRWLERLPTASSAERQQFIAWLKQSPHNVRELLLSHVIDDGLSRIDPQRKLSTELHTGGSNVVEFSELRSPVERTTPKTSRRWHWIAAAAATVAAVAATLLYLVQDGTHTYQTGVGEQLTVALNDGSVVSLNVKTKLEVSLEPKARNIRMVSGQALFTVAHDSTRPFRVFADGSAVNAVGTKFDVHRTSERTEVYVVEGRVNIEHPQAQTARLSNVQLTPGQGVTIHSDGAVGPPTKVDIAALSAWQNRRIVFEERSLAEIAEQFSAYVRSPTLVIEGDELRGRLYTGSFDADRVETFISYLQRDRSLTIERQGTRVIVRRPPA